MLSRSLRAHSRLAIVVGSATINAMLLPKFSIRSLLLLMVVAGFVFLTIAQAVSGQAWAIAICIALLSLTLSFLVYAAVFFLAVPAALVSQAMETNTVPTSPFATHQPPPQILPPQDPE